MSDTTNHDPPPTPKKWSESLFWLDFTNQTVASWWAGGIAVLTAISTGTISLPNYIPVHVADAIKSTDAFIVSIYVLVSPIIINSLKSKKGNTP